MRLGFHMTDYLTTCFYTVFTQDFDMGFESLLMGYSKIVQGFFCCLFVLMNC